MADEPTEQAKARADRQARMRKVAAGVERMAKAITALGLLAALVCVGTAILSFRDPQAGFDTPTAVSLLVVGVTVFLGVLVISTILEALAAILTVLVDIAEDRK